MTVETLYEKSILIARVVAVCISVLILSAVSGGVAAYLVTLKYAPTVVDHVVDDNRVSALQAERQALDIKHQKEISDYKQLVNHLKGQIRVLMTKVKTTDSQIEALRNEPILSLSDRELEKKMGAMGLHGKVVH